MSYQKRNTLDSASITREVVEAWRWTDYSAVARLLRLRPHECSPTWCTGLWLDGEAPCSNKPHKGCHRAAQFRDALNAALEAAGDG